MIPISKPWLGQEEIDAVTDVLKSGIIASGPKVKEFEKEFSAYTGAPHAIAVSNGTCAIHTALFALGVGKGDKVIVPAFTFIATSNSVLHAGAEPVFVDIDEKSFNIDPEKAEAALKKDRKKQIKAIICVHLYGRTCRMDELLAVAKKYKVKLIEDAAQAHGSKYKGRMAGTFGDAATFSMYATKNMTTGEGGMVTTGSEKAAAAARQFINHGSERVYYHTVLGYNYRTTDIEASIGLVQLRKLEGFNEKRRQNAVRMKGILQHYDGIILPEDGEGCHHIYHQFTIRVKGGMRDAFLKHINDGGIGAKIFYPVPLHKQPVYKGMFKGLKLPVTERLTKEVISLPVHPGLTDAEFEKMAEVFNSFKWPKTR
jgi:dTDP-4-amino-4,6-dideoxygalactose transaminase